MGIHNVWTHEVTIQSSAKIQMSFRTLLVNMYSEAIMLQVSISQCIVLFSPGPSVHGNLRLHVPVELHPPSLVNRHISILTLDCYFLLADYTKQI